MTDAKEYTSVVHLNDNKNYVWHDGSSDDVTIHWEIRKATLELPNVTVKTEAKNVPYDGEAYEEANIIVAEKTLPGDVVADAAYEYAKNAQFSGATENAPTDAGDYFVRRNYTYNADNYAVVGGIPSASFTINKATAQMTFTEGEVTATYTAQGTDLQQVTVDGLVDADKDNPASEVYNVTYTYKYRTDSSTTWEEVNTETKIEEPNSFKFTDVGEYQITATFSSNNYTATPAIYTLTIEKANAQKITLTSAGTNKGQWNEENKTYTTTYGAEASFTITGTAALDAENAAISYEVTNDGANVVSVDSGSGMVTIKQAGEATITVTAAETANVGAASVEYTVTVKKAKPTVSLTDKKLEVPYTGQPIEGYDKATATAEVVAGADQPAGDITYTFYTNKDCTEKLDNGAEGNVPIAVGTYYMKATYPGDTNYEPAESEPVTVTVTKAQLTVDAEGYTGTYNGETYPPITVNSVTGKDSNLSYEVYYMKDDGTDVPAAENEGWSKERKVKDVADSGKYWYKVVITGEHANDYAPYIASAQVTISAKVLQLTGVLDEYTKTYDGNADITDNFNITVTTGTSDEITVSSATGTYANKNAGKDKDVTLILTLSGTDIKWGNYSYNGTELTKGEITLTQAGAGTITPKAITVTGISAENRVYDGTKVVQLTGTPETTDKVGEDNLTLALASNATGSIESADVGNDKAVTVETSVITLGGDDANNYKVSAVKDAANGDVKVNITQRPVNLEFAGIGQDGRIIEKAYTGQPVSVTVGPVTNPDEGTGFVDSDQLKADDVDYTYTPVDPTTDKNHTTVGSYTVTAKLKKNPSGNYGNYELKFPAEATLEITPAEMVVIAEDYTGTYTGKDHNVTASWTAKTTGSASTEIEITTVEFIKKEDDTRPEAGAEGWDEISFINVAQSGEYWYKVTAENYAPIVGDSAVTITINPATLTLSSSLTKEKGYDGTTVAVVTGQKVTGAQNGENITVPSVSAAYDNANVGTGKTITITYTLSTEANLGNYKYNDKALAADTQTVSETVSDCSITQAPVTVTISDQTSVYDGKTVTPIQTEWKVSDTDLFDVDNDGIKDDLGITLTVVNAKNAGKYAITGTANNSNYAVTFAGSWAGEGENKDHAGTYTIDPRPINVEIGDAEGFYGDAPDLTLETKVILTPETAQGENAGLVEGENIYDALEGLSLGSYATVSSPVDDNYTIYPLNNGVVDQDKKGVYGNYDVTFTQEGTYTVKQRPITITIKDHSSVYGEKIDGGIATPLSGTDYTVAITEGNTVTTDGAIVNGDDLGITLFTTAQKSSDAGAYSISGKVTNTDLAKNYAITWKGQTPYQENEEQATYTVKKATLAVEFTNEEVTVSMGGTVNNPLKFINQSNSDEELGGQPQDVTVKYSSNDQGVATVNETTGEITLVGTGNATITAEVTSGGKNFTEGAKDSYIIHVAEDGGLLVTVTPKTLTYTGEMQNLISYSTAPAGAEVTFKVEAQTEGDRCQIASDDGLPQGQDAGTYRVSWVAKLQGYRDATGSTTVTIAKASPTTGFSKETVSVPYEENGTFDSTEETTLNVADDYKGTITYMSNDTRVASVQGNSLENISLNGTGSATITAVFTETDNYTAATASFRITVGTAETTISYTAEDYSVEYDRIAHGSKITVKSPSEYTIMYSDNNGTSYDLNESPTITDAGDLTIYFQIQADGYNSASGTQKVTVEPKEITANMVTGIAESYTYTGKEITFDDAISVHDEGVLLEKDKDYTITYDDNKEVGQGSVTITGRGNYKGSVTKNFTISPVDASDLTASLNRTFGYYGDSYTNNATVTVTHGSHTVTSDGSNTVSIAVKDNTGTDVTNQSDVVSINDHQTVTFNQVGTYTIEVTVTGNHETNAPIQLTYALLPVEEGKLVLKADNETSVVETYGDTVNGTITVTDVNGTPMTENTDYTLAYTYTPFEGTAQGSKPYDPSVMSGTPAAGMYVVTATGQGGYANSVGTFTFLILQRDLAKATLAVNDTDLVFNHDEKKPDVTVTVDGNAQPTKDTDYTITYYNNVNASNAAKAVVTATGNNFTGSKTADFTIAPKPITGCVVENIPDQYYTGNEVIPPVTIKDSSYTLSYTLILGYDYTTACADKGPGEATVTITGTGNYRDQVEKTFTIKSEGAPEPSERFDLVVTPSQWTWGDDLTNLDLSVTFGTDKELTLGTEYTLEVNGQTFDGTTGKTKDDALTYIKGLKPDEYTITATGMDAYAGSTDTETVTIQKIQPTVTVKATPNSLSGGGKVTLTLKGEKLPNGTDLKTRLSVTAKNDNDVTLEDLHIQWPEDGSLTAELTLPNTNETYTFTLTFIETATHAGATDSEQVVVAQQIISGGGGGGPVEDQPANPDDTGVSDWLNTKDHLAYLAGYPGGTFGPDQNMTRAEAAQMFYNLLLEKDVEITVEFEDVPADAWYAKPVNTLASLGILSGVGNGRFDPERSITRAEFTVIAMKFANTSGGGVNIFSDVNEDDWFYSAVVDSTQYGWINGYPDGTFRPEATISRAEVTVIVNHMLGRAADRPYVIAHEEELNTFGDVNRGHWGYFHVAEATNAHEYHTEDGTESWTGLS
ncbi:MAG: YDG domain-containing protein [Acutalibacter sp.]